MLIALRPKLVFFLSGLIVCLAFLSSAPTDPEARAGLADAGYNLFRRYVLGAVSTWDVLLAVLVALLFWSNLSTARPANLLSRFFSNRIVNLYFGMMALGIVVGVFVILTGQMQAFSIKDWVRSIIPVAYLFAVYFVVVNVVRTPQYLELIWKVLEWVAVALVCYGFYRTYGVLTGNIRTLAPGDIPIILYSEMVYFDLPVCVYCATVWSGRKLGLFRWILMLCMVGFVLASTRRFNYIMLAANILTTLVVAHRAGLFSYGKLILRSRYIVACLVAFVALLLVKLPALVDGIWFAIQTINMFSEVGFQYTGEYRLLQIQNIFLNFMDRPVTLLTGFGIGSKWHAIEPLPTTTDTVGSFMAFDANVVAGGGDWLPFFHVPYFSTLFRFGPVGMMVLFYIVRRLYLDFTGFIRTIDNQEHKIILVALASLSLMPVIVLGDTPSPVGYILMALNLGLIEGYRAWCRGGGDNGAHASKEAACS
ncbi:hypothetical protein [Geomonas azotofigens]|uniref:hypothetical protein n=1 Tax=Geomonas azotofigens TaxID=2843196 RepID=UPI001C108EE0|nr:hypothetical protein [Geomonas azotofigens]MBU5613381.1 hypothetical protein [Geomonas azotofigens]